MVSTRPTSTPAILTESPDFEFLHVLEEGVQVVAAFEKAIAAGEFENDQQGDDSEGEKQSQSAFNGVFHGIFGK